MIAQTLLQSSFLSACLSCSPQGHNTLHLHPLLYLFWFTWPLHCTCSDSLRHKVAATIISVFFCLAAACNLVYHFFFSPFLHPLSPASSHACLLSFLTRFCHYKRQVSISLTASLKPRQVLIVVKSKNYCSCSICENHKLSSSLLSPIGTRWQRVSVLHCISSRPC